MMYDEESPGLIEGIVVDTADPQEMGRLKVWCPSIDSDSESNFEMLPWAVYISPLAGQTQDFAAGNGGISRGPVSYGFWAIPKIGAKVLVGFLYNDYNQRIYMGSFYPDHGNRSLPNGRNVPDDAPQSDSYDSIEPMSSNLKTQFNNDLGNSIAVTRGAYERQVAQAKTDKDATEGYQERVDDSEIPIGELDPQTYCITTPGRHAIILHDNPQNSRVRVKTAEGHQIILDDANERIYISTSRGNTWIELDVDGHIHIHGGASVSVAAGKDINLTAGGDVNISAGGNFNLAAVGHARISACKDVSLSGDTNVALTAGTKIDFLAEAAISLTGKTINMNGPKAAKAKCADKTQIVPDHEPWVRPVSELKRNKNWKP